MPAAPGHYAAGPEALVVSLASNGDRDAFAELVRRRQSWIRNLMGRCCGDASLADDLSQQVFMQAWRKIRQLKEADKFGSWLKQLAVNEWLQYLRKHDVLRGANSDEDITMSKHDKRSVAMDLDRAIAARRRNVLIGKLAIVALLVALELLLSAPLQNSASVIAQVLSTSLVELEGGRLALMVAPINSIAGLIGMLLLGMQFLYRRMMR